MAKRKNAPIGLGRLSTSLGGSDPRNRRNAQMAINPLVTLDKTMRVDSRGRQGLTPARKVQNLQRDVGSISQQSTEESLNEIRDKINEMLQSQRDAGQMEGGR